MTVAINARSLRNAFGQFATGVTVVTSRHGDKTRGMTANSFSSVSLDPPMLLVCIANTAHMMTLIEKSGVFALSVLESGQQSVSEYFAGSGNARHVAFAEFEGMPVIEGALALFNCRVEASYPAGDHTILVGEITACEHRSGAPLLFHSGAYADLRR
ncbi:MAG: flavin reductase family protein [Rhizobiaceae bacterium]|nr:flavin reductase family protein [Rhizobiaceae bacterium]